jgi:hypothetical protein
MGDDNQGTVHGASEGGLAGKHDLPDDLEFRAGPTSTVHLNTARLRLIPVACFRVDDIRFDFDSSFVASNGANPKKDIRSELQLLVQLLRDHPQSPLSVFGHADPVGSDDYNKALSGRRATIVYALLISTTDPDTAASLWLGVAEQEQWGDAQRQAMLAFTGLPAGTANTDLLKAYMRKLTPPELKISKTDFLAQGSDSGGKGDRQGCSEFNPVLIFSQKEYRGFEDDSDKGARNDANAPNRRVMVLLFRKGSKVDPSQWPCPRAGEPIGGCQKRFWSDGENRRSKRLAEQDRTFENTKDTFACRFYQRLLANSPCEKPLRAVRIRLFDPQGRPLPFASCLVTQFGKASPDRATGSPPAGTTNPGDIGNCSPSKDDAFITVIVDKLPTTINVKWSRAKATENASTPLPQPNSDGKYDERDYEYEMDLLLNSPTGDPKDDPTPRLRNLGYDLNPAIPVPQFGDPTTAFQNDYKTQFPDIAADGTLNPPTAKAAKKSSDDADPVVRAFGDLKMTR